MNHLIQIIILVFILLVNLKCTDQLENNVVIQNCKGLQSQEKVPQKFALLTMTYNRNGRMDVFTSYLQHYATMKCEGFDQIYIVWNNEQTPQNMGIYQNKDRWINKVIITKTPTNKIDWKYSIPYNAQQQIFLALDDDERTSCREMMKLFNSWKTYAIGKIGPLYSFAQRAQIYNYKSNSFQYLDPAAQGDRKTHYFSVALMGCGFVSRHFMDLYYSDLQVIVKMRKVVQQKQNCEDILMNFVASYFYPQIVSKSMHIQFSNAGQKFSGLSKRRTHKTDRYYCLNKFSQMLGYNPLRDIKFEDNFKENVKRMDFTCLVRQKKRYLQSMFKRKTIQEIFGQQSAASQEISYQQSQKNNLNLQENNQQTLTNNKQTVQKTQMTPNIEVVNKQNSNKIQPPATINNNAESQRNNALLNTNQNFNKNTNAPTQQVVYKKQQKTQYKNQMNNQNSNDFSSISGVVPLQIQIFLISTVLLLLIVTIALKNNKNKKQKPKQSKRKKIARQQFRFQSNKIMDNQNVNQIDNQLEIQ